MAEDMNKVVDVVRLKGGRIVLSYRKGICEKESKKWCGYGCL